jgi:PAS domain S-box-containing protein
MQVHARRDRLLVIAGFVVLAAIAVGIAWWAWQQQARAIRRDTDRNLVAVSRLKAEQVSAWLAERRADAETIRGDRLLANGVAALLEGKDNGPIRRDVRSRFASLAELYHYEDVILVRPDGSVVMREPSTATHDMGAVVEQKVREAVRSGAVETTDLYRSEDGDVRLEMVAPVLDDAGRAIAAVVLHSDPGHYLFPLIQTWPIGGKTSGETLLVERRGDEVLFLNDLRFRADAALRLALPSDSPDLPAARAVRGEHGIVAGLDYRGVPVLAAAQPVPGSPWSVVAKVDENEVLGPISRRAWLTAGFTLLVVGLAAGATLLLWRAREARADAEIVASEERYRSLVDNAPVAILVNRDDQVTVVNQACLDLFGASSPGDLLGKSPFELFHPDDHEDIAERIATLRDGSPVPAREERIVRLDGRPVDVEVVGAPFRDAGVNAIHVVLQDITERKRAAADLRESEDTFRYVFDNSLLGMSMTRPDGSVRPNDALCRLLGYPAAELATLRWQDITPPEDVPEVEAHLRPLLTGESDSARFLKRYTRKDGSVLWADVSTRLRRGAEGEPLYFLAAVLDVTARKEAADEIDRLNAELERRVTARTAELDAANKELEAFAYSVSHDLRAPLRHISGFSTLLADRTSAELDEKSRHYVDVITRSVNEMGVLIDDLLQFSRTGRAELTIEPVDMDVVIQEALAPLRHETASRELDWSIEPVPRANADRALIRQVWANLLGNAVKYTRPVTPARIKVSASATDGVVVYSVADNGVGFDMQYAHKLFGVFQRLHDASEFEGTGIGLANVHRIVTRLHGRVWAEGELGKGATFSFSLPIAKETE